MIGCLPLPALDGTLDQWAGLELEVYSATAAREVIDLALEVADIPAGAVVVGTLARKGGTQLGDRLTALATSATPTGYARGSLLLEAGDVVVFRLDRAPVGAVSLSGRFTVR